MYQGKTSKKTAHQSASANEVKEGSRQSNEKAVITRPASVQLRNAQDIINNSPKTIQQKAMVVQLGRNRGTPFIIQPPTVPTLGYYRNTIKMTNHPGSIIIYSLTDPVNNKTEIHVHTDGSGGHGWTTIKNNFEEGNGIDVSNDSQYTGLISSVLSKHPLIK